MWCNAGRRLNFREIGRRGDCVYGPKLMGNEAKSLLNFASPDNMRDLVELEIKDIRQLGKDLRVTAQISPAVGEE